MWQPYRKYLIERHDFLVEQTKARLLSQFADIDREAEGYPEKEYQGLMAMPWDENIDESQIAELAQDRAIDHYELLSALQFNAALGSLACIYHEWDRNLREHLERELRNFVAVDERGYVWNVDVNKIVEWLSEFGWNVRSEAFFELLNAARLVVNVFKHGKGSSFEELAATHPEYLRSSFRDEDNRDPVVYDYLADHTSLGVSPRQLTDICAAIRSFWEIIPENLNYKRPATFPKLLKKSPMNDVEREAVVLNSAWTMIDDMVNWGVFVQHDRTEPTNLMFKTSADAKLFTILLGDFLSDIRAFKGEPIPLGLKAAPSNARPSDLTFLFHLRQVCVDPKLGGDPGALSKAIEEFAAWLEGEFIAEKVNFHTINVIADLRISRYRYLKMCGDVAKHSLARLATNVKHLRRLLEKSGHLVSEQDAYLAIEPFFEWFHEDIFIYHSSQIGEFLNNIRWAIYEYLQPEFQRSSYSTGQGSTGLPMHSFRIPAELSDPVAIAMYWDVMNRSRSRPYVHQFVISKNMKERY